MLGTPWLTLSPDVELIMMILLSPQLLPLLKLEEVHITSCCYDVNLLSSLLLSLMRRRKGSLTWLGTMSQGNCRSAVTLGVAAGHIWAPLLISSPLKKCSGWPQELWKVVHTTSNFRGETCCLYSLECCLLPPLKKGGKPSGLCRTMSVCCIPAATLGVVLRTSKVVYQEGELQLPRQCSAQHICPSCPF